MDGDELFETLQNMIREGLVEATWNDEYQDFQYIATDRGKAWAAMRDIYEEEED